METSAPAKVPPSDPDKPNSGLDSAAGLASSFFGSSYFYAAAGAGVNEKAGFEAGVAPVAIDAYVKLPASLN